MRASTPTGKEATMLSGSAISSPAAATSLRGS